MISRLFFNFARKIKKKIQTLQKYRPIYIGKEAKDTFVD